MILNERLRHEYTDAAKSYFDMVAKAAAQDPRVTVEATKVTSRAVVGDRSDYGQSNVICLAGDIMIVLAVEWDDYQDAGITYHFKPEEILEELGY